MKVLVAGFGNVLREDDGFGVRLLKSLELRRDLGAGVTLLEVGIGGVSFVQELLGGYDATILLDAVEGDRPGRVREMSLEVTDPASLGANAARDYLADVHYAEPGRALALAKAIGSLPAQAYLVGCVPASCELGEGLSVPVEAALAEAADRVVKLLARLRAGDATELERSAAWSC